MINETELRNVTYLKGKILSVKDCWDFSQREGLFFPKLPCYNVDFFYQYLADKKKLLTLEEHCSVDLPHYKLDNQLQKDNLFEYCINDDIIKDYLPDNCKSEGITRELLLSFIYRFRKDYFKKLNEISTEISFFKAGAYSNNFELEISKDKDLKLVNYIPLPTNRKKRSKLHKIALSNVLVDKRERLNNHNVNVNHGKRNKILYQLLESKGLNLNDN